MAGSPSSLWVRTTFKWLAIIMAGLPSSLWVRTTFKWLAIITGVLVLLFVMTWEVVMVGQIASDYRASIVRNTVDALKREGLVMKEGSKP